MCGCCVRIRAGISVRVRITVRDGVRISNRVTRRVKLVNYSLITALPIATSADPLFTAGPPARLSSPASALYYVYNFTSQWKLIISQLDQGLK